MNIWTGVKMSILSTYSKSKFCRLAAIVVSAQLWLKDQRGEQKEKNVNRPTREVTTQAMHV